MPKVTFSHIWFSYAYTFSYKAISLEMSGELLTNFPYFEWKLLTFLNFIQHSQRNLMNNEIRN